MMPSMARKLNLPFKSEFTKAESGLTCLSLLC